MTAKVSKVTQAVLDARTLYIKRLRETVAAYGNPGYMQQRVDPRTADRQIAMMGPEDMAMLAMTDPVKAEQIAQRAEELRVRAEQNPPPFSAPSEWEDK